MRAIADALVYAVTYINLGKGDNALDRDVGALESIAGFLKNASVEEEEALAAAAARALAAELTRAPREECVQHYKTLMEDMFGEAWVGNKRVG